MITGIVIAPSLGKGESVNLEDAPRVEDSTLTAMIGVGVSKKVQDKEMTLSFH